MIFFLDQFQFIWDKFEVWNKYKDSNELYKLYHCHLNKINLTWKFNCEVQTIIEFSIFPFQIVLIIANIIAVSKPANFFYNLISYFNI